MVQGRPERLEGLVGSVMPVQFALPWVKRYADVPAAMAKYLLEVEGTTEHLAGTEHPPQAQLVVRIALERGKRAAG